MIEPSVKFIEFRLCLLDNIMKTHGYIWSRPNNELSVDMGQLLYKMKAMSDLLIGWYPEQALSYASWHANPRYQSERSFK